MPDKMQPIQGIQGDRAARLRELGDYSTRLRRLDKLTGEAYGSLERLWDRRHSSGTPARIARAEKKYHDLKASLILLFEEANAFSDKHGLIRLPKPQALKQR